MEAYQFDQLVGQPLEIKVELSLIRIRDFLDKVNDAYIASSGGKDSVVMTHLVHRVDKNVPILYSDTGLEYPELRKFMLAKNPVISKPSMDFFSYIQKYGYPVISKEVAGKIESIRKRGHFNTIKEMLALNYKYRYLVEAPFDISSKCCTLFKKKPTTKYSTNGVGTFVGIRHDESSMRRKNLQTYGCNLYGDKVLSRPISFWNEKDVIDYIVQENVEYCREIYGDIVDGKFTGYQRTGCMFCMFGVQYESEPTRFQKMRITHPIQYKYCMEKLKLDEVLTFMGIPH